MNIAEINKSKAFMR